VGERRRSAKALANDKVIRSSAVDEIVRVGVDRLSLRDVGHLAGLSQGAAYARYEDVDELLIDIWNTTLRERLVAMSQLSQSAAEQPSAHTVGELFEFLRRADHRDRAAIEVLLVSRRIPVLREETETFVRSHLEPFEGSPDTSTRAVALFGFMMAQILSDAQFGVDAEYQSALEKLLIEALGATASDFSGDGRREHSLDPIPSNDEDCFSLDQGLKSRLARATYDVVGKSGYLRATTSRISRRSNCSPGAIYKFHRSKEELAIGAFENLMMSRRMGTSEFARMLDEGYLTRMLNLEMSNESALRRNFTLEMALAAAHCDAMRSTVWSQLVDPDLQEPDPVETDESKDQRLRYANRTIATLIVAMSWLATISGATASLNMNSFAEPLRRGLVNQWFPDGADS
jgi:AcrR family transcriptional regulator